MQSAQDSVKAENAVIRSCMQVHPVGITAVYDEGERYGEDIRCQLSPDQAVHAHRQIEHKEHRNIERAPAHHAQEKRLASLAEALKDVNRKEFAAHLDAINMITSPEKYFFNTRFLEECFYFLFAC